MTKTDNSKTLIIQNEKGLHARAAALFVKTVERFDADVFVQKDGLKVSGKSIMGLMMLGAAKGSEIELFCSGTEAINAEQTLERLVNDGFNEN